MDQKQQQQQSFDDTEETELMEMLRGDNCSKVLNLSESTEEYAAISIHMSPIIVLVCKYIKSCPDLYALSVISKRYFTP